MKIVLDTNVLVSPLADARRALEKIAVAGRYSREVIAAALVALLEDQNDKTDDDSSS